MQRHLMRPRDATAAKKFRWRGDHLTISRTLRSQQGQAQLSGSLRINPRPLRRAPSICSFVGTGKENSTAGESLRCRGRGRLAAMVSAACAAARVAGPACRRRGNRT